MDLVHPWHNLNRDELHLNISGSVLIKKTIKRLGVKKREKSNLPKDNYKYHGFLISATLNAQSEFIWEFYALLICLLFVRKMTKTCKIPNGIENMPFICPN